MATTLFCLFLFACSLLIVSATAALPSPVSSRKLLPHLKLTQNSSRKLLPHLKLTQNSTDLPTEMTGDTDPITSGSKSTWKLAYYKMFGLEDDHGRNCAVTNQSCVFDVCCHGCECLGFMLWCVGFC